MRALVATLLLSGAAIAGEPVSVESLQKEVQALRAQNAQLLRENADLKQQLGQSSVKTVQDAETDQARQEDKPKNRIRLPSNVTINHNPR